MGKQVLLFHLQLQRLPGSDIFTDSQHRFAIDHITVAPGDRFQCSTSGTPAANMVDSVRAKRASATVFVDDNAEDRRLA